MSQWPRRLSVPRPEEAESEHLSRGHDSAWRYLAPAPMPCARCGHDYAQHPAVYPRGAPASRPCAAEGCGCDWFGSGVKPPS